MEKVAFVFGKANLPASPKNHLDEDCKKLDEDCILDNTRLISMKFNHLRTSLGAMPNSLLKALEK